MVSAFSAKAVAVRDARRLLGNDEFREAVVLSDMHELSYKEIAEALDIPLGTVRSRIFRGRRLLRTALADYAKANGMI